MNARADSPSATEILAQKPVSKSGLFLWGTAPDAVGNARRQMLASYTQGGYADDVADKTKHYYVPKGSIDEGETSLQAAVREAYEETGISIEKLLGKDAYARFLAGETIRDLPSEGYQGVTITCADPTPIASPYRAGRGHKHNVDYFSIEVRGIEHLREGLKKFCEKEGHESPQVKTSALEHAQQMGLPDLLPMLEIVRSGVIRADAGNGGWSGEQTITLINRPVLAELEDKYSEGSQPANLKEWITFYKKLDEDDQNALKADFAKVKDHFKACGLVGDVGNKLKLDTTDWPMVFFQEGAEILPVETLLQRSSTLAGRGGEYDLNMWNGNKQVDEPRMDMAQVTAVVDFFSSPARSKLVQAEKPAGWAVKAPENEHLQEARKRSWQTRSAAASAMAEGKAARGV